MITQWLCLCWISDKKTPMDLVTGALNIFLQTKQSLNSHHEFALMFLDNCANWVSAAALSLLMPEFGIVLLKLDLVC